MNLYNGKIFTKEQTKKYNKVDTVEIKQLTIEQVLKVIEKINKSKKVIFTCQIYLIQDTDNSIINEEKVV